MYPNCILQSKQNSLPWNLSSWVWITGINTSCKIQSQSVWIQFAHSISYLTCQTSLLCGFKVHIWLRVLISLWLFLGFSTALNIALRWFTLCWNWYLGLAVSQLFQWNSLWELYLLYYPVFPDLPINRCHFAMKALTLTELLTLLLLSMLPSWWPVFS